MRIFLLAVGEVKFGICESFNFTEKIKQTNQNKQEKKM